MEINPLGHLVSCTLEGRLVVSSFSAWERGLDLDSLLRRPPEIRRSSSTPFYYASESGIARLLGAYLHTGDAEDSLIPAGEVAY